MPFIGNPYLQYPVSGGASNGLLTSLVAYWAMDESSGDVADATGNGHTAVDNSSVSATGKISNSREVGGGYLEVASDSAWNSSSFSVSFWVKRSGSIGTYLNTVISHDNAWYSGGGWIIGFENSDAVTIYFWGTFTSLTGSWTGSGDGSWHHIVVTFDGSTLSIYVDGSLDASSGMPPFNTCTTTLLIGAQHDPDTSIFSLPYVTNNMDEIGFWSRCLSSTDVTNLYNAGAGLAYSSFTS